MLGQARKDLASAGLLLDANPKRAYESIYDAARMALTAVLENEGLRPTSRGGHIASESFDHTSQLQLVAERFGVEVPNVSAWRKKTVGDLTSALFAGTYSTAIPALPAQTLPAQQLTGACSAVSQDSEAGGADPSVPTDQTMPNQQGGTAPASSSTTADFVKGGGHRTVLGPTGPRPVTTKSSYNRLAVVRV